MGGVGLGGLLVGLGLKLVSATRLRSHGWCWAAGLWCWLRLGLRLAGLGGSLDGLRLGSELLARLGLRPVDTQDTPAGGRDWAWLVSGWHTLRPVCAEKAWAAEQLA